jgi:hypothetical protein
MLSKIGFRGFAKSLIEKRLATSTKTVAVVVDKNEILETGLGTKDHGLGFIKSLA